MDSESIAPHQNGSGPIMLMYIGGQRVESVSGNWLDVQNPATLKVIGRIPRGTPVDIDRAVAAARRAFPNWRRTPPAIRGRCLQMLADDIEQEKENLARLLASETGNALRTQARPEITTVIDLLRYFGGVAGEAKGETIPIGSNLLSYTVREPYGVVAGVIPWNAPAQLAAVKLAMAIVTGNTLVLKAAEDASLIVLSLAQLSEPHLPPGVFNVVTGLGSEVGAALMQHEDVDKLSFTGSTEVGRSVIQASAKRILPVSLELGGKSPALIFPDVDDDTVAAGVIAGMRFTRQGQSCTAGSRLLIHESIFDSFLARMSSKLEAFRVGDPLDEATDIGTIINEKQYSSVCQYISEAVDSGGTIVTGGLPPEADPRRNGFYVLPTVIRDVEPGWRVAREEIFGPVAVAIPWRTEDEAISLANDSHYGLAAYVWTHDIGKALRAAHEIEAGWVQINRGLGQFPGLSYGGTKQSGFGREFSMAGAIDSFTQEKSITVNMDY